jgi:hypothetical protein
LRRYLKENKKRTGFIHELVYQWSKPKLIDAMIQVETKAGVVAPGAPCPKNFLRQNRPVDNTDALADPSILHLTVYRALKTVNFLTPVSLMLCLPGAFARPVRSSNAEATSNTLSDLVPIVLADGIPWTLWALTSAGVPVLSTASIDKIARQATDLSTKKQTYALATLTNALAGIICADEATSAEARITTTVTGIVLLGQYSMILFPGKLSDPRYPTTLLAGGILIDATLCHVMAPNTGVDLAVVLQLLLLSFWFALSIASLLPQAVFWPCNYLRTSLRGMIMSLAQEPDMAARIMEAGIPEPVDLRPLPQNRPSIPSWRLCSSSGLISSWTSQATLVLQPIYQWGDPGPPFGEETSAPSHMKR